MIKKVCYFIVIITLISCTQNTFETTDDMWKYLKDPAQEYVQTKTINGVDFSLVYKPTDLLVAQEATETTTKAALDSLRIKYRKYLYFNLSMSKNNQELLSSVAQNRQQFGGMVNQLAFGMEDRIHVFTPQKDTIPMADYIYPRMYGMSKATTLLLVYPRDKKLLEETYFNFTIEDLGMYTGEVKFKIPTEIIKKEPKLRFNR